MFTKKGALPLEERVADLLQLAYGHEGPFTEEQYNRAKQVVLGQLAALVLGIADSEDGDIQPVQMKSFMKPVRLYRLQRLKKQTPDKPRTLGWLKSKGIEMYLADKRGVQLDFSKVADKNPSKLIIRKDGKEINFKLSSGFPKRFHTKNITALKKSELIDFIKSQAKSSTADDIIEVLSLLKED